MRERSVPPAGPREVSAAGFPIPTQVVADPLEAARCIATEVASLVRGRTLSDRAPVIGLAAGRSPTGVYAELVRAVREDGLDLARAVLVQLDEYLGLSAGDPRTFAAQLRRSLLDPAGIRAERVLAPSPDPSPEAARNGCLELERRIAAAGGIDLLILGVGRNGHLGFNEPGSALDSRTRVVQLHPTTRVDAAREFGSPELVPHQGVTLGLGTIRAARRIRVLAFGRAKGEPVGRLLGGRWVAEVPVTALVGHSDARLFLDRELAHMVVPRRPDEERAADDR